MFFALARQRAAKHLRDRDAQKRRSNVRTIADVLRQCEIIRELSVRTADKSNRINIKKQCCRASLNTRLWVKDVCLTKAELKGLNSRWVFYATDNRGQLQENMWLILSTA